MLLYLRSACSSVHSACLQEPGAFSELGATLARPPRKHAEMRNFARVQRTRAAAAVSSADSVHRAITVSVTDERDLHRFTAPSTPAG